MKWKKTNPVNISKTEHNMTLTLYDDTKIQNMHNNAVTSRQN